MRQVLIPLARWRCNCVRQFARLIAGNIVYGREIPFLYGSLNKVVMESKWIYCCSLNFYIKVLLLLGLLLFQPSLCRPPLLSVKDDTLLKGPAEDQANDIDQMHAPNLEHNDLLPNDGLEENAAVAGPHDAALHPQRVEEEEEEDDDPNGGLHPQKVKENGDDEDDPDGAGDDRNGLEKPGPPLKLDKEAFEDESIERRLVELSRDKDPLAMKVLPPDHLQGVRMEQDGHINRDFRKEIIFSNHEEFEEASDDEQDKKLAEIFDLMDVDHDGKLTQRELSEWIQTKVKEHFEEAMEEATRVFKHLDSNTDGYVAWTEFHMHFLLAKGLHPKEAAKHVVDENSIDLKPEVRERLLRYQFRWAEADSDPQDNQLTLEEFKNFRHPESSSVMLGQLVEELLDSLDKNGDKEITEDEFVALPPGEVDEAYQESDKQWQDERSKEFKNVIDLDKNGKVSVDELKKYVDPGNRNHSEIEAENLIALADENGDGVLTKTEVLENLELFLGSKVIDTGKNFHDEF